MTFYSVCQIFTTVLGEVGSEGTVNLKTELLPSGVLNISDCNPKWAGSIMLLGRESNMRK